MGCSPGRSGKHPGDALGAPLSLPVIPPSAALWGKRPRADLHTRCPGFLGHHSLESNPEASAVFSKYESVAALLLWQAQWAVEGDLYWLLTARPLLS